MTGIYKIESLVKSKRFYIGSAVNIKHRWECHLSDLRKSKHKNKILQNHYNKYGEQDLVFIILELCFPEFLTAREQYYINKLGPYFNICKIAGNQLGIKRSEETRRKISETKKGKKHIVGKHWKLTNETKQKLSEIKKGHKGYWLGKNLPEETKQKMSEAAKGKHLSDETRKKMSKSLKGRPCFWKGKHRSEEMRGRLSISRLGIEPWNKGKKLFPHSEETKKRMSIAQNKRRINEKFKIA